MAKVICPACRKAGNVPDEFLGQRIKCPSCGERFAAPKPLTLPGEKRSAKTDAPPLPAPAVPARVVPPPTPVRFTEADVMQVPIPPATEPAVIHLTPVAVRPEPAEPAKVRCPFCAEEIQAAAKKCRHCGELLDPVLRAAEESKALARQAASHGQGQGIQQVVTVNATASGTSHRGGSSRWTTLKVGIAMIGGGFLVTFVEPSVGVAVFGLGILVSMIGVVVGVIGGLFS